MTEQHRTARHEQILLAAMACVAKEGFHRTTMADVIAASGLSSGAVYGYFRSKDDLIIALADRAVSLVGPVFADLLERDPLPSMPDAVEALTSHLGVVADQSVDITRVAVAAWAEAVRNPDVHERVVGRFLHLRGGFISLATRLQEAGRLDPDVDPAAVGRAAFGVMPGYILQRLLIGDVDPHSYAAGLAALGGQSAAGLAALGGRSGVPRPGTHR